jgi:glycosyltransferase involved in cell wall biosynthesis
MSVRPLNILIVASWYPDDQHPTNGSFVEEQAQMLVKAGHRVTVLHPFLMGTFLDSLNKKDTCQKTKRSGVDVIRVGVTPTLPGFRGIAYQKLFRFSIKALAKLKINAADFDLIHSHALFMGGFIAMHLGEKFGKPFFHTEHTSGLIFNPEQYSRQDIKIIKSVYQTAQNVFFVSRFALEKTLQQYGIQSNQRYEVLSNVVDTSFFESPLTQNCLKDEFSYIIICNLIPLKKVDLLITAWCELLKVYPNSKLTIAGEGSEKERLSEMVRQFGIQNSVLFLPRLSRAEVREQIPKHHVLVSTSQLETFGLTVAEAQAMGKPVVVTDSGGVRDIVEADTGIISDHSIEKLADGLIQIQQNFLKYDHEYIRQKTFSKFSSEKICQRLISYYTNVNQ